MRRHWILPIALFTFLIPLSSGWTGERRIDFDKVRVGLDNDVRVQGGVFQSAGGFTGWKSNIPYAQNEKRVMEKNGSLVYDLTKGAGFSPEKGTLEFWVYFDGSTTEGNSNRLVSFTDNTNSDLFGISVNWFSQFDEKKISLGFYGPRYHAERDPVFGRHAVFNKGVKPGQWIHLAVTWGPGGKEENVVYLNGVPAVSYYNLSVKKDGTGSYALFDARNGTLSNYISGASKLVIGSDPDSNWVFRHGLISDVALHDQVLKSFDLSKHKPVIRNLTENSFSVPGISGKLVAGDALEVSFEAEGGGTAYFEPYPGKQVAMAAIENTVLYKGRYVVQPGDYVDKVRVAARFSSASGFDADPVIGKSSYSVDARSRFAMTIDKTDLPADSAATARVKVKVTDANGNPIKDHQIKVTLSTTDEYTGLVGGGSARYRDVAAATKDMLAGADVETRWKGITDSWGEVEFDFKSGFAAKTIILQAKDMTSGNIGVDYITSYKEASIDIVLTPPISRAAARRGLQYMIKIEATRTELTADGRSRSVIRATVQDPTGKPVAGDNVVFSLSSANGTLNTIKGTTDTAGVATAEYIAGKKIGIVVVTATDTVRNISASVSITLLADAPAKILLKARPETMPADGNSRADISVKVTDINDNPNKDTKVEFRLSRGSGKMDYPDRITDRFGDTLNRFTAGTTPGISTIVATVRSKVPTVEELARAQNVLFVPYSDQGEDIRISQWLKKKGDTAAKGEPIVEYTFGRSDTKYTLNAPYDCRIDFQFVEYWDNAKTGDTLALITPVILPGAPPDPAAPTAPILSPRRR